VYKLEEIEQAFQAGLASTWQEYTYQQNASAKVKHFNNEHSVLFFLLHMQFSLTISLSLSLSHTHTHTPSLYTYIQQIESGDSHAVYTFKEIEKAFAAGAASTWQQYERKRCLQRTTLAKLGTQNQMVFESLSLARSLSRSCARARALSPTRTNTHRHSTTITSSFLNVCASYVRAQART
jgi:hypothetical protein